MRIFVDIDGTLTHSRHKEGEPWEENIRRIRDLIEEGHKIILWSGRGGSYARRFARRHGLKVVAAIGKPHAIMDDRETIRPVGSILYVPPEDIAAFNGDTVDLQECGKWLDS